MSYGGAKRVAIVPSRWNLLIQWVHSCPRTSITMAHCLNPFAVHLVVGLRLGVVKASISLLADEQVGEVDLHGTEVAL